MCESARIHDTPPPSKALRSRSWALIVSVPATLIPLSDVVLQSSLATQVAQLQGCLVRVGSFLERAEIALSRLSLLPAMLKNSLMSCPHCKVGDGSTEDRGALLYGCFSPCVEGSSSLLSTLPSVPSIAEVEVTTPVVPPVLQIMHELQDLCASTALPL
jgi:hypothetical protein